MNAAEKIAHAAERKAFEAMLDSLIRKSQTKDVCTCLLYTSDAADD